MKQLKLIDYELKNDLKKFRQANGLSQIELAKLVGTSQVTISSIECGTTKNFSVSLAIKIAMVLGYRVEDIFYILPVDNYVGRW